MFDPGEGSSEVKTVGSWKDRKKIIRGYIEAPIWV